MNPGDAVYQKDRVLRFYDCFAAERSLRQLLQVSSAGVASGYIDRGVARPSVNFHRWRVDNHGKG